MNHVWRIRKVVDDDKDAVELLDLLLLALLDHTLLGIDNLVQDLGLPFVKEERLFASINLQPVLIVAFDGGPGTIDVNAGTEDVDTFPSAPVQSQDHVHKDDGFT